MKKLILSFLLLAFAVAAPAQEAKSPTENSQWLTQFSEINISGPFNVVFEQIPETEAPRIVYDAKGSYTSRFQFEVKNGVLSVSERAENRRTTVTDVKIYFHALTKLRISGAAATFLSPLMGVMMDVVIGGGAVVTAPFEVTDLKMDISGKSRAVLSGAVRYLSLAVSTAKVDAVQLQAVSLVADVSNYAELSVTASERLEAKASTGGRISYGGDPLVLRTATGITGGEITKRN